MKNQNNLHENCLLRGKHTKSSCRLFAAALLAVLTSGTSAWLPSAFAEPPPPHDIIAGNIDVVQNDLLNTTNSVTVTAPYTIGDFRIRDGSSRGDFNVQIGFDVSDDVDTGVLISSVAQNGRDMGDPIYPGTNFCTSHIDNSGSGTTNGYFIPVAMTWPNASNTSVIEWNVNLSAAWFPYTKWLGGYVRNTNNGGALMVFTGSPGLVLGTHFVDLGGGKARVDLTSLGIDSRTNGVLLVMGAKNEDNYALSQVNTTNGTWTLHSKDNGTDGASTEQDPLAFVYIPRTNTNVVSGRFFGDGTIDIFSGATPQFTINNIETGRWELKVPGRSPANGVLIISPEGGLTQNRDNIVTYQVNDAGDGWIIESRDLPGTLPPLETPAGGAEPVASLVFIPGALPGFTVTPTNNLFTTENGDTAAFTVVLDTQPAADVTVNVASDNAGEGIASPGTLTFTSSDWNVPQTVTITGQDDVATDGAVAYTIVLSPATSIDNDYAGRNPVDVAVSNLDNDGGITVNPTSGLTTTEAGGMSSFTIVLNQQPTADVTIGLSSSDTTEGTVSPTSVTFNNGDWNQPQTVTITGVNDDVDDGNIAYTIITAPAASADPFYNAKNAADVSASNLDDDTAGITVSPTLGLTVVESGGITNFTVVLNSQPTANVTVNAVSSDTTEGTIAPGTLTFTPANWSTPQAVTITGVDDLVVDGNIAYVITNTASSSDPLYAPINPADVSVTTLDDEAVLTLPSGGATYGIGMPAIGIDGRATLVDPYTPNYNMGTLTVTLTANGTADDRLSIRSSGGPVGIAVTGSDITYNGTEIGSFTGGAGTTPLEITFNNAATPEAVEALVRAIVFSNVSSTPSLNLRSVSVVLEDADGGTSSASTTIRVGLLRVSDFQEGADHGYSNYTGAADIELYQLSPDTAYPAGHNPTAGLWIDYRDADSPNAGHTLLRFDNIIGNSLGQIPLNAIVVSAELILDINDSGDASPLYRMLIPWNAETETWNSMGDGVDPDDIEASSTFDSQFGLANGDGATTIGSILIGVTADVQAWLDGTNNYGWAMPAWTLNLDGTGFSPSEAANIGDRPRLRVSWVPAGTAMASFRQGVNGYSSARDTRIRQNAPDADNSTVVGVFVDAEVTATQSDPEHVLLRFDDIIGAAAGQIPSGARIDAAVLDLGCVIGNAMGDGGKFHALLQTWEDTTSTWNFWVNGIQADGVEAATTPTAVAGNASLNPDVQAAYLSFELTSDVQAWTLGTRPNYGWAVLPWPNGGNGWGFATAEATVERNRPQLRVFYTANAGNNIVMLTPVWSPSSVQVSFTATVGNTYSVLRAPSVTGPWTPIGSATVQPNGTGTFTDNSPLAGAAFYIVRDP